MKLQKNVKIVKVDANHVILIKTNKQYAMIAKIIVGKGMVTMKNLKYALNVQVTVNHAI